MTFYKYAEKRVANQMDWSVVGKSITAELEEEQKVRDARRSAIEKSSQDILATIANAPMGEHKGANNYILDYSGNAQDYLLQLNRDLKSGKIKPKDYIARSQNLKAGTDTMFALGKEYQTEYKTKMDLYLSGSKEVSAQTVFEMSLMEGLSNFEDTKPLINPFDGSVAISKMVLNKETGQYEPSKNPMDIMTPQAMRNRLKTTTPQLDVDAKTAAAAKAFGKDVKVVMSNGVLTLSDPIQKTQYEKAENEYINSLLVRETDAASILADFGKVNADGVAYSWTTDEKEAASDPSKILMVVDPKNPSSGRMTPKLSEKQMEQAREILRTQIRTKLDREETPMPIFAPRAGRSGSTFDKKEASERELARDILMKGAALYHGGSGQIDIDQATEYLRSLPEVAKGRGTILKIDRTPQGVRFNFSSAPDEFFDLNFTNPQGQKITQKQFLENLAALVIGRRDISDIVSEVADANLAKPLDTKSTASSQNRPKIEPFKEAVTEKMGLEKSARERAVSAFSNVKTASVTRTQSNFTSFGDAVTKYFQDFYPDKKQIANIKYEYDIPSNKIFVTVGGKRFSQTVEKGKEANQAKFLQLTEKIWNSLSQGGGSTATPQATNKPTTSTNKQFKGVPTGGF